VNRVTINDFVELMMSDSGPPCLLWLPIFQRLAAVENGNNSDSADFLSSEVFSYSCLSDILCISQILSTSVHIKLNLCSYFIGTVFFVICRPQRMLFLTSFFSSGTLLLLLLPLPRR